MLSLGVSFFSLGGGFSAVPVVVLGLLGLGGRLSLGGCYDCHLGGIVNVRLSAETVSGNMLF